MSVKQILVIDDEADIREIAKMSLQITKRWKVLTAASGEEGVAIATKYHPDAILLDVVMPEMDGLLTLKTLKNNPETKPIPVIMLTATGNVVTQRQYAELGAQAVLTKPFDPGLLGNQIATALNWRADF
ncbi:response regulator [Leptothermofonsia sichuanensis E412]|uniref:response regulator n=1 Tax=Leptothermofonsia sichuanensis TaxID=2917832 RepID=UPI001CA796B4|nr:response regulator [Leptothermofonsia sichuanensis]QZZ19583.1 response regulator [Leptothermofonsia sichuanensis E412]